MSETPPPPPPPNLTPPPGYAGYQPTNWDSSLRAVSGVAKWISVLLVISAVMSLISLATAPSVRNAARDYLETKDEDSFNDSLALWGITGLITAALSIALVVLSIIWLYRVSSNHRTLGRALTWAPGWAIGGWFLPPGVLYVIPMLVLRETWKAADPRYGPGDDGWKRGPTHPALWVWWVLYGLAPIVFIVVGLRSTIGNIGASTRDIAKSFVDNAGAMYVQGVVSLLAVVAWAAVVWLWTDRHNRLGAPSTV
jgi:hypothetical protein